MKSRIHKDGDAVEINWKKQDFVFACCDCGLTHILRFKIIKNKIRIRVWVDKKTTQQLRKKIKKS